MKTNTTLPTAILSFAFTSVFGPHRQAGYEAPRPVSAADRTFIKSRPAAN